MKIFSLFLTLLLVSCNNSTVNTRSYDKGVGVVSITDANGSTVLSYSGSYALVIGQSDYTAGWQDLNSIPSELNQVVTVLKDQGFVVDRKYNLNSEDLPKAFENFIKKYGYDKDNRLLFFYSGHGHSRGDKGYIVPVDAPNPHSDDKGFFRKAVAMNQVVTWAKNIESKHALFLFDSCFSGTVFKSKNIPRPKQINQAMRLPVRQFITAGSAKEEVPAKSTFTPAFVHALTYAAGDTNNDGYVTGMELGLYLWNEVPKHTDQTPQFGRIKDFKLSRGDFVFKVKNKSTPAVINVAELDSVKREKAELDRIKRQKQAALAELDRVKREKAELDRIKRQKQAEKAELARIQREKAKLARIKRQKQAARFQIFKSEIEQEKQIEVQKTFACKTTMTIRDCEKEAILALKHEAKLIGINTLIDNISWSKLFPKISKDKKAKLIEQMRKSVTVTLLSYKVLEQGLGKEYNLYGKIRATVKGQVSTQSRGLFLE